MNILVFAEQRDAKFKKAAFETVSAGRALADQVQGKCSAVVIGHNVSSIAGDLGAYGATEVLVVDSPSAEKPASGAWAAAIVEAAKAVGASVVLLSATQMGKDIAPRVAVGLEAGLAADCTSLRVENNEIIASRPVYAGKAITDVRVVTPVKVFSIRPNVFSVTPSGGSAAVKPLQVQFTDAMLAAVVTGTKVASGRPDVAEADIVVSGGRGMKGPEHFHLIEELADVLHGGVGASRAVVDAGWRPHDEQVGQTGKTVSPSLYIACGISGAVQHLAGMSSSKYIVAINKDKDAPIFQLADYGIVGDVFEILPELTLRLKEHQGH